MIKVADFGLTENMYDTNYFRREKGGKEEKVPIRWMAPESIEDDIYNEATDVVSAVGIVMFYSGTSEQGTLWRQQLIFVPCREIVPISEVKYYTKVAISMGSKLSVLCRGVIPIS